MIVQQNKGHRESIEDKRARELRESAARSADRTTSIFFRNCAWEIEQDMTWMEYIGRI